MFVNLGYSKLDNGIASLANNPTQPPLNLRGGEEGLLNGWTIDQNTGRLTTTMGLDLGGNSIQNVSAILSASGNWRVDENGLLVVEEVRAKRGTFEEGVTIYDKATGLPKCVVVENDMVRSNPGACDANRAPPAAEPDTASSTP